MSERARRIGKNLSILMAGQITSRLIASFVTIYMARVLGVANFGIVTLAITVVNYLELVVNWGYQRLGSREVARTPKQTPQLVNYIVGLKLFAALSSVALLGLLLFLIAPPPILHQIIILYSLALFSLALNINWVFIGLEQIQPVAFMEIVMQVLMSIGIILFVTIPSDIYVVPIITLVANIVAISLLWWVYLRQFPLPQVKIRPTSWFPYAKQAVPRALSDAMGMLNFNFDMLMTGLILGIYATGLYGAAYRIILLPSMLVTAYFTVLNPSLDQAYKEGFESVASLLDKSLRLMSIIGVGLAVGGTILAEKGFHFLYKQEFDGGILSFQILLWAIALMFINRNYRSLLIAFDYQRDELIAMMAATIANVIMNIVLIPLIGIAGAAIATVCSELVVLIFCFRAVKRHFATILPLQSFLRIGIASGVLAITLLLMPDFNLFLQIIIGGIVYLITILGIQVISREELFLMIKALSPRANPIKS